jgi:hypothetical protein
VRLEDEELSEYRECASSVRKKARFCIPGINHFPPFLPLAVSLRVLCAFAVSLRFEVSLSQHRVKKGLFDSIADSMGT